MKSKLKSYVYYQVRSFSSESLVNKLNTHKINFYDFIKNDEYVYSFKINALYEPIVDKINLEIVEKHHHGIFYVFKGIWLKKSTLISLAISIVLFFTSQNFIWGVKIEGNSIKVNEIINNELDNSNIKFLSKKLSVDEMNRFENKMLVDYYDIFESFEMKQIGVFVKIKYQKRRDGVEVTKKSSKLYAKRDGVIVSFDISSGDIKVKINQFVKKGDLLVDDYIVENNSYLGTRGKIWAITYYIVTAELKYESFDEAELFSNLLNEARNKLNDKELIIQKEIVLDFKNVNKTGILKIHFSCLENIATTELIE